MSIDLAALVRRRKPEKRSAQFVRRDPADLVDAAEVAARSGAIHFVPDTTVYIHAASGRLPGAAREVLRRGLSWHCSVCLAELAAGLAHRDPSSPRWKRERDYFTGLFQSIPPARLLTPDPEIWTDAALVAGALARTQGLQRGQRKELLNDALIYLTAAKRGLPVLTANIGEFDLIQQVAPEGRFIGY